jgi:hypothetical protein
MQLHREAWVNGWTYGPGFDELYEDYLVNWIYFVDYLDFMIKLKCKEHTRFRDCQDYNSIFENFLKSKVKKEFIKDHWCEQFDQANSKNESKKFTLKIFIGEAPPYWKGMDLHNYDKRNYFYHPLSKQSKSYFDVPSKIFLDSKEQEYKGKQKVPFLAALASKGFVLIDIFPFPIIQETEIRQEVTGAFGEWISIIFNEQFNKCINYVTESLNSCCQIKVSKEYAIATPLYGALQICFGETTRSNIISCIDEKFYSSTIKELQELVSSNQWEIVSSTKENASNTQIHEARKIKFLLNINPSIIGKKQEKINTLNQKFGIEYEVGIPILTTGGINLHEKFFFNSTEKKPTAKKNLRKKTTAKKTTVKKPTQKKPPKNSP